MEILATTSSSRMDAHETRGPSQLDLTKLFRHAQDPPAADYQSVNIRLSALLHGGGETQLTHRDH